MIIILYFLHTITGFILEWFFSRLAWQYCHRSILQLATEVCTSCNDLWVNCLMRQIHIITAVVVCRSSGHSMGIHEKKHREMQQVSSTEHWAELTSHGTFSDHSIFNDYCVISADLKSKWSELKCDSNHEPWATSAGIKLLQKKFSPAVQKPSEGAICKKSRKIMKTQNDSKRVT